MKNSKYWKIIFETETGSIWLPGRSNQLCTPYRVLIRETYIKDRGVIVATRGGSRGRWFGWFPVRTLATMAGKGGEFALFFFCFALYIPVSWRYNTESKRKGIALSWASPSEFVKRRSFHTAMGLGLPSLSWGHKLPLLVPPLKWMAQTPRRWTPWAIGLIQRVPPVAWHWLYRSLYCNYKYRVLM